MASKAVGSKFYYGVTGAEAATQIARVRAITPPTGSVPDISKTHLESTAQERLSGLPNYEGAELVIEFEKTQFAALRALLGTARAYKILYSDGSKDLWEGYINEIGNEALEIDGLITAKIGIAVDGVVTFTAAP